MSREGINPELLRLAAAQAKAFLPAKKKAGRKKHRAKSLRWDDPDLNQKLMLGKFYNWPLAQDLLELYVFNEANYGNDPEKLHQAALATATRIGNAVVSAICAKDHECLKKLSEAVEMLGGTQSGLGFAELRKVILVSHYRNLVKKQGRKPSAAEVVAAARAGQVEGKILSAHLDEALFRDIRELGLPVAAIANKNKKKR